MYVVAKVPFFTFCTEDNGPKWWDYLGSPFAQRTMDKSDGVPPFTLRTMDQSVLYDIGSIS